MMVLHCYPLCATMRRGVSTAQPGMLPMGCTSLISDRPCVLQAASEAYDVTLAPVHTYFVRMAVKTSMYLLPDRATFLSSIGETGPHSISDFGRA